MQLVEKSNADVSQRCPQVDRGLSRSKKLPRVIMNASIFRLCRLSTPLRATPLAVAPDVPVPGAIFFASFLSFVIGPLANGTRLPFQPPSTFSSPIYIFFFCHSGIPFSRIDGPSRLTGRFSTEIGIPRRLRDGF